MLSDNLLGNLLDEAEFTRLGKGKKIYLKNKLDILNIDEENINMIEIKSIVEGSYTDYEVNLILNINENAFDFEHSTCECIDHLTNTKICKHIIATAFEYIDILRNEELNAIKNHPDYKYKINKVNEKIKYTAFDKFLSDYMIEEQKSEFFSNRIGISNSNENKSLEMDVPDGKIKIIPIIKQGDYYDEFKIVFKIGFKQMYSLKDLTLFFDNMQNGSSYRYGAKLEFYHKLEKFDDASKELLNFILKYAKIIKYANDNSKNRYSYYSYYEVLDKGSISLKNEVFDELFDMYLNKGIQFELYDDKKELIFLNENPSINFELEKLSDNEYKLVNKFNSSITEFNTLKNTYTIVGNYLYKINKNFNSTLKLLKTFASNKNKAILIKKEELPVLFSTIVPKIKENIKFEKLEEELEKYTPKELGTKIFLDFDENDNIISEVKFCYDDFEFNPFSKEKESEMDFVRDLISEKSNFDFFKETGFEIEKENMLIKNEEKIYEFLSHDINKYIEKFEVMITDNFKKKQIRQPKIGTLGVRVENNLLKINFDKLDFDKSELKNLMQKYNLKKKYHRLKDGSFLDLQTNEDLEIINSVSEGMDIDYKELAKGQVKVPVYRTIYLEKLLDNFKNTEIVKNDEYKDIINKVEDKEDNENIKIPNKFDGILRTYQKTGYKWLKVLDEYKFGGILADDMGLGKTLQLIVILYSYIKNTNEKDRLQSIVVCPSSLTINWKNEVNKFAPDLKVLVISGKIEERIEQINKINEYDLIVTSYDLLKRDIEKYNELNYVFKYVIADEAQYIKNSNTKNAIALKNINANIRYALTGTPIENSLSELWSIFDYIMPGYLFSYSRFKKNYEVPIIKNNDEEVMKRLKMLIEPFVLRRLKKEVLTELPDKTISILNNEMGEEQNKLYLSYLIQAKKEIQDEINFNGFEKSQIKILSILTRLRQICCHPSLFIENYKGESSKLNQCIEIISEAVESEHKILLFSQFTSMFEILEKELNKLGIKYFKLTGQTKVSERIKLVDEFNKNKEIKIFLISLKAGGTGLNLTGADMVIHYDPWWNLSAENQATDRAYRIGQKNNVQVYKLITQNTIEEKINEIQNKKAELMDSMLSTEETFINKLSKEDIMSLFE